MSEQPESDMWDTLEEYIYPLVLSVVFLSIYFIVEIPSHWEKGFHMFYFILMSSFLGYICFCFNNNKNGKLSIYMDVLALFSILFFSIYFLFTTFMNMSGNNQNTFLKGILYIAIGFVMFLLLRFRVPNDVSKYNYALENAQDKKVKLEKPQGADGKGKSYFVSIITEPFYIVKDALEIFVCLFNDDEKWETVKTLLKKYISYHSPGLLLLGFSSFVLYTWMSNTKSLTQKSGVLIDSNAKSLDTTHVVSKSKKTRNYSFSLSGRLFIEQPLNVIDKEYNIIDYGDIPRVTYNPKRHSIYVYMKNGRKEKRVHEIDDIAYQKWNHFVFNYSHNTMDIFWNTILIASIHEMVPYMTMDSIVVGEHQGIRGGMKELRFSDEPLSMFGIYSSYYFM